MTCKKKVQGNVGFIMTENCSIAKPLPLLVTVAMHVELSVVAQFMLMFIMITVEDLSKKLLVIFFKQWGA